jgi:mono/diheme cytochrome c family protein
LLLMLLVLLAPAFTYAAGGWAIITVDDLPEYLVAGQPTEISFTVRQHGLGLLSGLAPSVEAKSGGKKAAVNAVAGTGSGRYTVQLTVPQPGEWTITIRSGFGPIHSTLLPLQAIARGAAPPAPAIAADRGARLFVAKGCVGCHLHGMIDRPQIAAIGPELTGRKYPAEFLAKRLADPASVQGPGSQMPNLGLRQDEIQALVAFINSDPAPSRK